MCSVYRRVVFPYKVIAPTTGLKYMETIVTNEKWEKDNETKQDNDLDNYTV